MHLVRSGKKYYAIKNNGNYYGLEPYIESDGIAYTKMFEEGDSNINIRYVSIKFQTLIGTSTDSRAVFGTALGTSSTTNYVGVMTKYISGTGNTLCWSTGSSASSSYIFENNDNVQEYIMADSTSPRNYANVNCVCFGYYNYPYRGVARIYPRKIRLWYLRIYGNTGILQADYVPSIVSGEVGLYDRKRNKFFPNVAGSGELKYCI